MTTLVKNKVKRHKPIERLQLNQAAIAELGEFDRILFQRFGAGPVIRPDFANVLLGFEHNVRVQPNAIAVEHLGECISYADLDSHANKVATTLGKKGIGYRDRVGLFVRRGIPMVAGLLGILKRGAAYVPQDAKISPIPQLQHVEKAAELKVILGSENYLHRIPQNGKTEVLSIERILNGDLKPTRITNAKKVRLKKHDPCFVLFTSGTTGKPNGVEVTHGNLANILLTAPGNLSLGPGNRVSQILNVAFDMAAWEILGALANGATLVIRGDDFKDAIKDVDTVIATPSILSTFSPKEHDHIRTVAVAGEPCPKPLADAWSKFARFFNACGPTEVTIVNTMKLHDPKRERLTIGAPTPNNTVYILNEKMQPCAMGEIGEMWAGGDCVSLGYLKNEKLNSERYKPDPFLGGDRKMFRTRDLGRWTTSGELEHFGRTDDQVKIKGFRVELDSVSAVLEKQEGCKQAVTLKLDNQNLVSFVRPGNLNEESLKEKVADELPYYCTPKLVISMDEFPKTDRGKIDKRALTVKAVAHQEGEVL